MFVLWVLNAPVTSVVLTRFSPYESSTAFGMALAVVAVVVNGALYGFVVGLAVTLRRRMRGPKPAP